jgi:hypothetical protein
MIAIWTYIYVLCETITETLLMKFLITIFSFFTWTIVFSQASDSTRVDSVLNYEVKIPSWLRLIETGSSTILGGTLPAVNGIENAITVRGFSKSQFKSFDEFKYVFLTGNKFGEPTKFDSDQIWYGQNELMEVENGVKQKIFIYWRNKIYHNLFVLLQSNTAYLLVQFVSTSETYDINISKFDKFLSGLKINKL